MTTINTQALLLKLLNKPGTTFIPVKVSVRGELQVLAIGPGLHDRVVFTFEPDVTYNLIDLSPASWWLASTSFLNATSNGWIIVDAAALAEGGGSESEPEVSEPCGGVDALTFTTTMTLDLSPSFSPYREVDLTADATFVTANLAKGCGLSLKMKAVGGARTPTFPAGWHYLGDPPSGPLASGKIAVLSLTSYGTTDAEVVAVYAVEQ